MPIIESGGGRARGQRPDGSFMRAECFKVEKHLLTYGWGRWRDISAHA